MLDRFLIGRVSRMSPEAPVPVVVFDHEEFRLGGAANVAHNLRTLGASVDLIGVIGADESGTRLKSELAAKGIHVSNEAASIVVGKFGASTVTPEELKSRF